MGSQQRDDEINVLVTGFLPFRPEYPVNPSWEIAKTLPPYLPEVPAPEKPSRSFVQIPPVRIILPNEPIRVNYETVREIVPSFWDAPYQGHKIDIAIHIGMAGPRPQWVLERRGHRTGYKALDVDGQFLKDERVGMRGEDWIWHDMPEQIATDLDLQDILMRWQSRSPMELDLRISEDAGNYLCDFIYYSSLSHLLKQQRARKVVFFHVPADASDKNLAYGRDLIENLIRAIVESEVSKKRETKDDGDYLEK